MLEHHLLKVEISFIDLLAAYAASWLFVTLLQRYLTRHKEFPAGFKLKEYLLPPIFLLLLVIGFEIGLPSMGFFKPIEGKIQIVTNLVFLASCYWLFMRTISFVKLAVYTRFDASAADNLRQRKVRTQLQFVEQILLVFAGVVCVALGLMNFEAVRKVGSSLIASAGLAGVVLGFAAQKSLGNLLAGFQIAFTQPIRIDDVVIVEGEWGRIEEINLTYVVVRIWDKRALVVPITYFVEKPFQNWTRASADLIGVVFVYADYSLPIGPVREEARRLVAASKLWDQKIFTVQVTDLKAATMEVRVLMGAYNAGDAFDLRCAVREGLIDFIQKNHPDSLPRTRVQLPQEKSTA